MLTQTKQTVHEDNKIISKIDRMPEPTAFEIETAKKSKEGLELEVHVLAEVVPGPGLVKRCYVKPNVPGFGAFELYCDEGLSIGSLVSVYETIQPKSRGLSLTTNQIHQSARPRSHCFLSCR